jgi:hypothetical protein
MFKKQEVNRGISEFFPLSLTGEVPDLYWKSNRIFSWP